MHDTSPEAAAVVRAAILRRSPAVRLQQVLELSPEPMKNELRQETTGKDPWGTPYQLQCDQRRVHVFSLGPDKVAGTADDILPVL